MTEPNCLIPTDARTVDEGDLWPDYKELCRKCRDLGRAASETNYELDALIKRVDRLQENLEKLLHSSDTGVITGE